jgi:two-component system cell cycle response regulator DivK
VVLVIDDDEIGRTLIREYLPYGAQVIELSSPIGATRAASESKVDVVVLDLEMPNLRGDSLTKLFRDSPRLRHIGVILVSGCQRHELAELGQRCGADLWLSKAELRSELAASVLRLSRTVRARTARALASSSIGAQVTSGLERPLTHTGPRRSPRDG